MFQRTNTEAIMTLMKYSLDLSNPWVTKYYGKENGDRNNQSLGDNRNIFKVWLTNGGNELLKIFSMNGRHLFPHEYGLVSFIKYKVLNEVPYTSTCVYSLII